MARWRPKTARYILGVCGMLGASVALAADTTLTITEVWARESPPAVTNGAAYMTITNRGPASDRLIAVSGDVAETIELHTHIREGSVMTMRRVEAIALPPGVQTVLQPGGLHMMLMGLKQPLVAGHRFPVRLRFERAGEITVDIPVRKPRELQQ